MYTRERSSDVQEAIFGMACDIDFGVFLPTDDFVPDNYIVLGLWYILVRSAVCGDDMEV